MFRITKQKKAMGIISSFLFFYSSYNYSLTPAETVKIGVISDGGGLNDTLPLSLRTKKVQELLLKTGNVATTIVPYSPDGAQILSIIGGEAYDAFPGGYAPESELFYYGGGNLFYEGKQYQSIYQAFHKEKVRLLYHGMTSDFNNTAAKEMVQSLLLDMINDNKTLIIWPSGYNPDLSSSYNADISLKKRKALEKGTLLVAGYDSRIQVAHIESSLCSSTFNSCLMAHYIAKVPFIPGAVNNTENDISSGAKFSAAIATGIAAQVLQKFPWMNSDILRQTLLSTAQRKNLYHMIYAIGMPSTYRGYSISLHGWGLVNLAAALKGPSLFDSRLNLDKNNVVVNVDDDSGSTYTFSHDIQGDVGLDKTGKGILELSGKNQYQGTTSVKEGVLKMTGSLINAPQYNITVHRGATLELAGTVSSSIVVKGGARLVLKDGAKIKKNLIVESGGMLRRTGKTSVKSTVDGNIFADEENFLKDNNGCLKVRRVVIFHPNNQSFSGPHNNFHEFGSSPKDEDSNIHNGFFGRRVKNMNLPYTAYFEESKINLILNQKSNGCD